MGAVKWDTSECSSEVCEVPVMGDDGSEYTAGYMQYGGIPTFEIYHASKDEYYEVIEMWLEEPFEGGRHQRRIDKLDE